MGDVLAFIEHREGTVRGVSLEALSAAAALAAELGGQAHAVVLGAPGATAMAPALAAHGAATVRVGEHEALATFSAEAQAPVVVEAVRAVNPAAVLFAATSAGRDLAPRVAALLGAPLASDVVGLKGASGRVEVRRPVYSGKAFARMAGPAGGVLLATLRPNAFAVAERPAEGRVESWSPAVDPASLRTRVVGFEAAGGALDVGEAPVVVSGGRGMKGPEHWALLEGLRDALGQGEAALGASRAVVDAGWRPHGEQVGQTGKTVSPKLYFAVGISGAIQHLAGMRSSGTIVAINKDADAPIFQVADYGIVGDAFEVVPRLSDEIARLRAGD